MKIIKKRQRKSSTTMSDEKFEHLVNYIYEYELKYGHKPKRTEYSKVVAHWNAEHKQIDECRYDKDVLIY